MPDSSPSSSLAETDLAALVPEWLDWHAAGEQLDVPPSRVRTLVQQHELAAAVPVPGEGPKVPADLIMDGFIVKGVGGMLTLLHDAGFDDHESIAWMFLDQEDLPGRPIDALRENRGAEAKRRAQAMGL